MQILTLQVHDSILSNLLTALSQFKDKVIVKNDNNIKLDPYFSERQKYLHKIRKNIKDGKSTLLSFEELENNINQFEEVLELKYAN